MSALVNLACSAVLAGLACAGAAAATLSSRLGWWAVALLTVGLAGMTFLFT